MNVRRRLVTAAGGLLRRDFPVIASGFGAGPRPGLSSINERFSKARSLLPSYDAACSAALSGGALRSSEDFYKLPYMTRADLAAYSGRGAMASLSSGGTGSGGRVETRLDLRAVAGRYAALLSVLETAGWRMGRRIAALHPDEYSFFGNLPANLRAGKFGGVLFEFFQQYVLYRLVHDRRNVYYSGAVFSDPAAALALAEAAAAEEPEFLITRPDALMAVLKALRGKARPAFPSLKAVITVGTALGQEVRAEAKRRLGADVFDMYASTELGYVALSCPASGAWLHTDGGGHEVEAGEGGELVCTDLDNSLAPVLRYRTGDIGELRDGGCACGRAGKMLKFLGRKDKFVETSRGRLYETGIIDRVFPLDLPFFQLDAAGGAVLLPAGCGEREAAVIREALGLPAGAYGAARPGNLKISSSGKFCYLP